MENSKISLLILILVAVIIYPFGSVVSGFIPAQGPTEITSLSLGDTIVSGTKVVDDSKIRKVPLLYHPEYIVDQIKDSKYVALIDSIITGTVETPVAQITSGSISREGNAQGFDGPGVLAVKENKLVVNPPAMFVYGYKIPYIYGVKTKDGLQIKQGKSTVKVVPYDQINNDTVPHEYLSISRIKKWYNGADTGDQLTLDYAIGNINDGRNLIPPDKIKVLLGDNVINYLANYPSGAPVIVYMGNVAEKVIASSGDTLGSYPEYGDTVRESNAREFARAWSGTIIPPHSSSSGRETVGFDTAPDPHAPGGSAAHGVCPAARALRAASYSAGFSRPIGLSDEDTAVMFGFNPAVDVKVTNNRDYPIKIIMWTEGSGTGMSIYSKIIEYRPQ